MNKIKIIVSWQNFGVCILILRSVVQKFENKVYATLPRKSFTAFWQSLNSSRDLELSSSWWNIRQSLLLFQCSLYNEHEQNIRCHCWEISTRQHCRQLILEKYSSTQKNIRAKDLSNHCGTETGALSNINLNTQNEMGGQDRDELWVRVGGG